MEENTDNILVAVLHLKEASRLLDNIEDSLSLELLKLAKALMDVHAISNNDIEETKKLFDSME